MYPYTMLKRKFVHVWEVFQGEKLHWVCPSFEPDFHQQKMKNYFQISTRDGSFFQCQNFKATNWNTCDNYCIFFYFHFCHQVFNSIYRSKLTLKVNPFLHWEKNAIESIAFLSKSMYITDSNQYAIELVTYLLVLVVYFYEFIVYMLLERNAFDSIAFFSQCRKGFTLRVNLLR